MKNTYFIILFALLFFSSCNRIRRQQYIESIDNQFAHIDSSYVDHNLQDTLQIEYYRDGNYEPAVVEVLWSLYPIPDSTGYLVIYEKTITDTLIKEWFTSYKINDTIANNFLNELIQTVQEVANTEGGCFSETYREYKFRIPVSMSDSDATFIRHNFDHHTRDFEPIDEILNNFHNFLKVNTTPLRTSVAVSQLEE